jgi:hypothetical protein
MEEPAPLAKAIREGRAFSIPAYPETSKLKQH